MSLMMVLLCGVCGLVGVGLGISLFFWVNKER